jgi:hypothetical protein
LAGETFSHRTIIYNAGAVLMVVLMNKSQKPEMTEILSYKDSVPVKSNGNSYPNV